MITKFPKNNKWNLEEILCEYKKKINEIIDIVNTGGDVSPEILNKINELVNRINTLSIDISSNTRNIKETNKTVLTNITDIENIKNELKVLKGLIGEENEGILEDLSLLLDRINSIDDDLTSKIDVNKDNIIIIQSSVSEITNAINNINNEIKALTISMNALKDKSAIYDKDISDIKSIITELNTKVEPILDLFNDLDISFTYINNRINGIDETLNDFNTKINKHNSIIEVMDKTIENHETRLSIIEGAGGTGEIQVIDNLESTSATFPLSANQGRILREMIGNIDDVQAIKSIIIEENGDIIIENTDKSVQKIDNNYIINAEIIDNQLKLSSSKSEIILDLPNGGTIPKHISRLSEDTMNDGIGVWFNNGDYERIFVKNTPTIAKSINIIQPENNGKISYYLNNGNSISKDTNFIYDIDFVDGELIIKYGNGTSKNINIFGASAINNEVNIKIITYYKEINGINIEITEEEFYSMKNINHYYKYVNDEKIEISEEEFYKI